MYTGNNLDNKDKGKLITSHPYLPFCRHIIPIFRFLGLISFVNKVSYTHAIMLFWLTKTQTRNILEYAVFIFSTLKFLQSIKKTTNYYQLKFQISFYRITLKNIL